MFILFPWKRVHFPSLSGRCSAVGNSPLKPLQWQHFVKLLPLLRTNLSVSPGQQVSTPVVLSVLFRLCQIQGPNSSSFDALLFCSALERRYFVRDDTFL